jgi:hypothetical protein
MRRILLATLMITSISLIFSACGSGPPEIGEQFIVERVPDDRPRWITWPPEDRDGKLFFIGMKTHASSLENGNTDARQNGIQKIVEYVGGTGMVDYTKARVEAGITDEGQAGNYIEDGYRFLAESIAQGVREDETYYERVKAWQHDGWHYFYNYYALLSTPKDALERAARAAFEKQAAEARAKNDARAESFANRLREQLTTDATSPQ